MEKEREDKILEAIGRQREDLMAHMDKEFKPIREDLSTIKSELGTVKSELDTVKKAVLENSKDIKENSKDIKDIKDNLNIAITNHEQRIREVETKINI